MNNDNKNNVYPLTLAQQDIYFDQLHHQGSPLYNIGGVIRFKKLDIPRLQAAHKKLVSQHDAFGLRIVESETGLGQYVSNERTSDLPLIDFSSESNPPQAAQLWLKDLFETGLDIDDCELFRSYLLKISNEQYQYVGFAHHLILDGWGFANWAKQLGCIYNNEPEHVSGDWQSVADSDLAYQQSKRYQKDKVFWQSELENLPQPALPPLYQEQYQDTKTPPSHREILTIPHALHRQLALKAKEANTSASQAYLAILSLYFSRLLNGKEFIVGIPSHNRRSQADKNMVGIFTGVSPLRVSVDLSQNFNQLCESLSSGLKHIYRHQRYPIGNMHQEAQNGQHRGSLYDIAFNYLKLDSQLEVEGHEADLVYLSHNHEQTPLMFTVWEYGENQDVEIQLDHNLSYISKADAKLLSARFETIIKQVAGQEITSLEQVEILPQQELDILNGFARGIKVEHDANLLAHELFEQQVEQTPDKAALIFKDEQLSYRELNTRANRLARYLQAQGVKADSLVGVCVDRSAEMVISILAILKAGAAYVPLDPSYPKARLQYILEDTGLKHLVNWSQLDIDTLTEAEVHITDLNHGQDLCSDLSGENLTALVPGDKNRLAYVIYTSGSTGNPKGVLVQHANLINFLFAMQDKPGISSDDSLLAVTSTSFDIHCLELFLPLICGAKLVVASKAATSDARQLMDLVEQHKINIFQATPATWRMLLDSKWQPQAHIKILCGGEALSLSLAKQLTSNANIELWNMYGPTETTVWSSVHRIHADDENILIGKPIDNTQFYVVNRSGELAPVGATGELLITGSGVTRGYLNRPDLTDRQFIANSYQDQDPASEKAYRTGDLVRWLPDGNLVCLGRIDDQIKIRGFRVELGEIENQLALCPQVASCLVAAREDQSGQKQLVAYVKPEQSEPTEDEQIQLVESYKQALKTTLPDYMVPSAFVFMAQWPLTANGKIDKKALPSPDSSALQGEYIAPETVTEKTLCRIWAQLLTIDAEKISADADFFTLGGHSLLSVRLVAEIREQLKVEISVKAIFDAATIKDLAAVIEQGSQASLRDKITASADKNAPMPLSFAQQRLWFIDQLQGGSSEYNMPGAFSVQGDFDSKAAEQAFAAIIERHEILRTVYIEQDDVTLQRLKPDYAFTLVQHDLTALDEAAQTQQLTALIQDNTCHNFDLSKDLMVRASYIRLDNNQGNGVLLFNMHHIAADGWSMDVLIKEFVTRYQALTSTHEGTQACPLAPLEIQYSDYARWQREWLQGEVLETQLSYWQQQLADVPPVHTLVLDKARPEIKKHSGARVSQQLSGEVARGLQDIAAHYKLTPFMLLHSALALVLSRHSNSTDIVVGTPVANRMQTEVEPLIGLFVNTLVLRVNTGHRQLDEYLSHVRQVHLDAQNNQDVPFEQLVDALNIPRSTAHTPLFQIMLTTNTEHGLAGETDALTLDGVTLTPLASDTITAKFDLDIGINLNNNGVDINWTFDSAIFSPEHVSQFNDHLTNMLTAMAKLTPAANTQINALAMLSAQEHNYLLHGLNDSAVDYPQDKGIHELFAEQVLKTPDNIALVANNSQISYRELEQSANRLARYLLAQGVAQETFVGVCLNRSPEMVVAILAILKAGGAYVPLDPAYPESRLQHILTDTGVEHVLTNSQLASVLAKMDNTSVKLLCLDDDKLKAEVETQAGSALENTQAQSNSGANLAYVIYTSGSTGLPKGVMVEHHNVTRLVTRSNFVPLDESTRFLQAAPIAFDAATLELWGPLLNGGQCIIYDELHIDLQQLTDFINSHKVNSLWLTAGLFEQWSEMSAQAGTIKYLLAGGDVLNVDAVNRVMENIPGIEVINGYGPTENTTFTACHRVSEQDKHSLSIPIGKAIQNTSTYVLTESLALTPFGAVGELYTGGAGVARGYLNQEQATQASFIANPFNDKDDERLYKTGDLVRYLSDGTLEFIGRADNQVKVRGFRIELSEIEHQLNLCQQVHSGVVLAKGESSSNKQLVAYVKAEQFELAAADQADFIASLKAALTQSLPDYMVPSAFVLIDAWPLTGNGKIDKKALPSPDASLLQGEYIAPQTDTEKALCQIWAQLLTLDETKISTSADFFTLGGHSLLSVRLVSEIRKQLQVELTVKSVFEASTIKALAAVTEQGSQTSLRQQVKAVMRESDQMPLSFAQQRLWFIDQLQGSSVEYNMSAAFEIRGDFNADIAEQALSEIIRRHEVLRTVYIEQDEQTHQQILANFTFALTRHDLTPLDETAQKAELKALIDADMQKPFNLKEDLMVRASFVTFEQSQQNQTRGALIFNMHHIASDGWSMEVLIREFVSLYQSISTGSASDLPELEIQYADYAHWQREWLQGEVLEAQLSYWDKQLADVPPVHSLALDKPRAEMKQHTGASITGQLSGNVAGQLKHLAARHQLTPFMLLHSALALVLSRHSNSKDIIIGTPVANRLQAELEPLIGFFVNTLVLRLDTNHQQLEDYLAHVRQVHLDGQNNQDVPFEQLVERLNIARSTAHTPLFQIMLSSNTKQNAGGNQSQISLPGVELSALSHDNIASHFDLDIGINISETGVDLNWTYDNSIFTAEHISQLNNHLMTLLSSMAALESASAGQATLASLNMLSVDESKHLLESLNDRKVDYPQDQLIHELFEAQVLQTPDNIALSFEGETLSYRALNEKANRLAHYLKAQGTGPETLVGICLERSQEMLIAILAVLKAGGAYVPLDPSYPEARLQYMIQDSGVKGVLTKASLIQDFAFDPGTEFVDLDNQELVSALNTYPADNLGRGDQLTPDNLAYTIYTSGSTGNPKGVIVEHHALVGRLHTFDRAFALGSGDVVPSIASFAFDISLLELIYPLTCGAEVKVLPRSKIINVAELREELKTCTFVHMVPSLAQFWLDEIIREQATQDYPGLKYIATGGDAVPESLLISLKATLPEVTLLQFYGPTEAVLFCVCHPQAADAPSSLGLGLDNVSLYVLDDDLNLQPQGAVGELYIGGSALARGYLHREDLTRERFIPHPFNSGSGEHLYQTGDLVRYLPNGELEFKGRKDDQVKIRGFRVELGEIEQQLAACPQVASNLVLAREDQPGQKRLVAYVQLQAGEESEQESLDKIRQSLKESLTDYMVPSAFVVIEQWPLTANDKIDKKALPVPGSGLSTGNYQAPETGFEKALVQIWAQLLNLEADEISTHADFFELGGHSLLTVRLVAEIRKQLAVEISVKSVFDAPTIKTLAEVVKLGAPADLSQQLKAVERESDLMPLSFAQQRLWFIDQMQGASPEYNMPAAFEVKGNFDCDAAELALASIIERHEVLRTVYLEDNKQAMQKILPGAAFTLTRHDLTGLDQAMRQHQLKAFIDEDMKQAFDLKSDLMIRASYIALDKEQASGALLFNMHHIASDGWSMDVLIAEFVALYQALTSGQSNPLPPLEIQYADYAHWQREWLQGEVLETQLSYWDKQLSDVPPVHSLVLDQPRPDVKQHLGDKVRGRLSSEVAKQLQALAAHHQLTPFMLMHGALSLMLSRHSNSQDIVIGTPFANRGQAELEPLIGFFVNTLVLRVDTGHTGLEDYLQHVRQVHLDAQNNQDVPFEQLVERLNIPRSTAHTPLFQIILSTNNDFGLGDTSADNKLALTDLTLSPLSSDVITAKFDLDIELNINEHGVELNWTFDTSIFTREHVSQFNEHLEILLTAMAQVQPAAATELNALTMLPEQEKDYLLHELNDNAADYPRDKGIHELFAAQAKKTPDNIALVTDDQQLTYRELDESANRLARYLSAQGVGRETLVGVCLNRSIEMTMSILAILKAGGAYVPLEPTYPESRLQHILTDTGLQHVLTATDLADVLAFDKDNIDIELLCLDDAAIKAEVQAQPATELTQEQTDFSNRLAYVLYTSGTTGKPKGVQVEHHNVTRLVSNCNFVTLDENTRFLHSAPVAFDAATLELWGPLLNGGQCIIFAPQPVDLKQLTDFIVEHKVNTLWLTAGLFEQWSEMSARASCVKYVLAGGDVLHVDAVNRVLDNIPGICVVNGYGPTENTTFTTCYQITDNNRPGASVPIGKAVQNTSTYVLNKAGGLTPVGAVGELYTGGDGVARGYLNREQATQESFIANPFSDNSGDRLYKTGDLVRYLSDGNLKFVGRIDDQVKVRGFRIELAEIEHQINACPSVHSAMVLTKGESSADKQLVAYVKANLTHETPEDEKAFVTALKATLSGSLPNYMMPNMFVMIDEWSLTANGKVDKTALLPLEGILLQAEYVAPEQDIEKELVQIWSELLTLDPGDISIQADFFELGGHSLLASRLVTQINEQWQIKLPVILAFERPTIFDLAAHIKAELAINSALTAEPEEEEEAEEWIL
ncbi:non-ribosomal peptide synthetase [Thalassomonas actiniarum]|uniref:Non-ribosomal peptide synthetase n=1 Tax=Thalassomonas actiniarum TaxID=485447 RepID=A0AAF0C6S1_9GAMM|nr:non-ribosomal peptide synthetase [Thalassomonas actiniarum]WDE02114.1 non-ribosomal peptide synthetase [Thalassomonas actiniarum]